MCRFARGVAPDGCGTHVVVEAHSNADSPWQLVPLAAEQELWPPAVVEMFQQLQRDTFRSVSYTDGPVRRLTRIRTKPPVA